jgi:hypothetical protein
MRFRSITYLPVFLISAALGFAPSSRGQTDPYVSWGDGQIADLRAEMHEHMTPSEVSLDRSIEYRVVQSGNLNAYSDVQNREIVVYSGLLRVIDATATMNTVAFLWNQLACFESYEEDIAGAVNSNSISLHSGIAMIDIDQPFPYMYSHPSICPQVSPDVILNNDRRAGDMRTLAIQGAIKFVLLHEFAHQLHNDSTDVNLAVSRDQEAKADEYAFQGMATSTDSPGFAAPIIVLFCSMENFGTSDSRFDHPAGVRRLKLMVSAWRSSPQFNSIWKNASPAQRRALQQMFGELGSVPGGP